MSQRTGLWISLVLFFVARIAFGMGDVLTGWGLNQNGQVGVGDTNPRYKHARIVEYLNGPSLTGVTAVACGAYHSMALTTGGAVKVWGRNDQYQLGLGFGDTADRLYPLSHPSLAGGVRAVACGGNHSLALKTNNTLWGWGLNEFGQLGVLPLPPRQYTPNQFPNLTEGVLAAAGGLSHTLALLQNSTVKACGNNAFGQLGLGASSITNYTMTLIPGLSNVIQVACGNSHSVALLSDHTVQTWGLNQSGQLGVGDTTNRMSPTVVSNLEGVAQVACGAYHTLF